MPLKLNKQDELRLGAEARKEIKLAREKPQRRHKPSSPQPQQRDRADILAIWLAQKGIPVITEAEYKQQVTAGSYQPFMAVCEFHFARPERDWRADFAWPGYSLLCEVDGGNKLVRYDAYGNAYAAGHHTHDADYEKRNSMAERGYLLVAFTTSMLNESPLSCVETIYRVLEQIRRRQSL